MASQISFAGIFLSSAFAACFAEFCTLPLDTAKVRLQLQKRTGGGSSSEKYRGLLGTVATIAKEEGLFALWKGIIPGLHRQCIYGGLRIGLYEPVKVFLVGSNYIGDVSLFSKILAALVTGTNQSQYWWEAPIGELALHELEQLKESMEDLKKNVTTQATKLMIHENSNSSSFLAMNGVGIFDNYDLKPVIAASSNPYNHTFGYDHGFF